MRLNNKFLATYRELETLLRKNGFESVKAFEDSLNDDTVRQGHVRICRVMRNYMEHEDISFIEASDKMISFLQKEALRLDDGLVPVKKKMIPISNGIRDSDPIIVGVSFMTKKQLDTIPIFDKTGFAIGVMTEKGVMACVASGDYSKARKISSIVSNYKFAFVNESTPFREVLPYLEEKKIVLVMNNDKKILGWL